MGELLEALLHDLHWAWLLLIIAGSIAVLGWAAEWLVREAVALSERSGVPKVVIGATVVSLGTTAPEVAVSVMAAVQGDPDMAMGNAVGSIICDTGLVLGVACLIRPLTLPKNIVNRQGWIQFAAGVLLVAASWPWSNMPSAFSQASPPPGRLTQGFGFAFLALLAGYLWLSARWAKQEKRVNSTLEDFEVDVDAPLWLIIARLVGALAVVILASHVLIHAVRELASQLGVSEALIAATVVAFGTSLPELVTGVTAARHGHGDLAVGNVVGADILNALFVAGASAAVTPGGLPVSRAFFIWLFPFMLAILFVFRIGIFFSGKELNRRFGVMLLGLYSVYAGALVLDALAGGSMVDLPT